MRNSMTQQRRFTKEFEEEAVRLAQTSGRTQREIAGDLGIGLSTLVQWVGRSRDRRAVDPAAAESDVTAELKRLRRENEILRQERDILKKATAFFAREGALDFLPAVKDWMAEAATRPGISGRRDRARLNEGGLWPTAPLVRRGLGQRELAAAAAHRPPQAAGRRHCVRHAHRSGPAPAGPHSGCGTWDRSAQPPAPSGRQRCATGPGQRSA